MPCAWRNSTSRPWPQPKSKTDVVGVLRPSRRAHLAGRDRSPRCRAVRWRRIARRGNLGKPGGSPGLPLRQGRKLSCGNAIRRVDLIDKGVIPVTDFGSHDMDQNEQWTSYDTVVRLRAAQAEIREEY